jgi:predicted ATPase
MIQDQTFVYRVELTNYKSIACCDLKLGSLAFLVGANGSGKSNFLDALRFVTDGLRTSLDHALRERGGINEVRRRSRGHPTHFSVRLSFKLSDPPANGVYSFRVGAQPHGGFEVQDEECSVELASEVEFRLLGGSGARSARGRAHFRVRAGRVARFEHPFRVFQREGEDWPAPPVANDRLYLVNVSGLPLFSDVYDALTRMGFYNINPQRIRELQAPESGELLDRQGENLASVIARLGKDPAHHAKHLIEEYLVKVVPTVKGVEVRSIGPMETLEFRQSVAGSNAPWRFLATNMSDGTLRAVGVLTALFQTSRDPRKLVKLVGIEEPEAALHPAAVGVLLDCLRDASNQRQVVVTSHSPDLLDNDEIGPDVILAVTMEGGITRIGPVDSVGRQALKEHLYTVGELLRLDQLRPEGAGA